MIDTAYLSTLPSLARIRKNPRQWNFFCWLLSQAKEDGYAEVNVREFSDMHQIPNSTVHSWLNSHTFRTLIETTRYNVRTLVYFSDYAIYMQKGKAKFAQCSHNTPESSHNVRTIVRDLEEKFPPAPPIKEEYVNGEVASLQEKEKKAAGATFHSDLSFDERRMEFWRECQAVMRKHPEYPQEGVKSFFLFWTEIMADGEHMKFEVQNSWGTGWRMWSYLDHGHWLTAMKKAKLDAVRARGGGRGKTPTTEEIRRKEAALEEEKREHDRLNAQRIAAAANSRSREDAMCDPRYWLAMGVENRDTYLRAKRDPRYLAAFNEAVEIAKKNAEKSS